MKFVHIADMHFDAPFSSLNMKGDLGDIRRIEQRKILKKIIEYIKQNNIDYLFISGDFYEHSYIKKSTIDYINSCFREIPNTNILISPGNHDPYILGSYYETYSFPKNVYIFKGNIEKKEFEDVNIYGMAFTSFYMDGINLESIEKLDNSKPNIFIVHCDLNGSKDENGFTYNNISKTKLESLKFDYVAMGHIHETNYFVKNNNYIIYPGSPISMGFDELGSHGMIVGEITKNKKVKIEFVNLDDRQFVEEELDVESYYSEADLVIAIQSLNLNENYFYKIILKGKRNFEINPRKILKLVNKENILKVKDCTKLNYNIVELARENNLRGFFIREALKKLNMGEATKEEIDKVIEIVLDVL
ncbi:MAG: DNA repair exonuclease [Clostridia bacterium]|nr:DNA repair exonuclease [Clostridia bacterium]